MSYTIRRRDTDHRIETFVDVGFYATRGAMMAALVELETFHPQTRFLIDVDPRGEVHADGMPELPAAGYVPGSVDAAGATIETHVLPPLWPRGDADTAAAVA